MKDFGHYTKEFFNYLKSYKTYIIIISLLSVLESVVSVICPKLSGTVINALSGSMIDLNHIFELVSILFICYCSCAFFSCLSGYFISLVTVKVTYDLRKRISEKIDKISFDYFQKNTRGDILSRVTNDVDTLSDLLAGSVNQIISSVITSIGVLIMMFYISWEMSVCALAILPVVGVVVVMVLKKSQKYFVQYQTTLGKINEVVEESCLGYEIVKSFKAEKKAEAKFKKFNNSIYEASWKSEFLTGLIAPAIDFISKVSYVISCIMGGYFAVVRGFLVGDIAAFITYSGKFVQPLISLSQISGTIQQAVAVYERIFEFLNAPEETSNNDSQIVKNNFSNLKSIEFKNIYFGYDESIVINNFSFKIKAGQSVAIVGETGAGKSTLINLLMRFYNPSSGSILLNGENICNIDLEYYRSLFGVVTQDCWLYSGSILENIRYGNLSATDDELKCAAQFSGASHFIEALPDGYNTLLGEQTANISQGQKQLLCIARMLLNDAPIFVMDEATSSVDVFTENQIQLALQKIKNNKTCIIIAHRLSTIKN